MNRVLSLGLILATSAACVAAAIDPSLDTRGGAFFAAAVKVEDDLDAVKTRKKKQKLTDRAWSQATTQGARLEAEAVRSAQSAANYKSDGNGGFGGQTKKLKLPKSYWSSPSKKKSANKQVAVRRRAAAATKSRSRARSSSTTRKGEPMVPSFRAVDFEKSITSYQGLDRNSMFGARRRRPKAPQTSEETKSTTTTTTTSSSSPVRRRRPRRKWRGRNNDGLGLEERLFDTALASVITVAALTSVSDILAAVIDHYENAIYGDLSLGMIVSKQRILGGVMELGSVLLMLNPQLRQLGAFFITVMYTGSLINSDLAAWETIVSGAVAAMALYVFAYDVMTDRDYRSRRV